MTRVDWPALLGDIAYLLGEPDRGNPLVRIPAGTRALATYLHVERETLRGWLERSTPKHHDGEALIAAWVRITNKPREFVPVCRPVLSAHEVR